MWEYGTNYCYFDAWKVLIRNTKNHKVLARAKKNKLFFILMANFGFLRIPNFPIMISIIIFEENADYDVLFHEFLIFTPCWTPLKGWVISESIFKLVPSPKNRTKSLSLNFSTKIKSWVTEIWFIFSEDGTKLKIHSEITPPLKIWVVFQESLLPLLIFNRFQYSSSQYNMDASCISWPFIFVVLIFTADSLFVARWYNGSNLYEGNFLSTYLYSQWFLKMLHATHIMEMFGKSLY